MLLKVQEHEVGSSVFCCQPFLNNLSTMFTAWSLSEPPTPHLPLHPKHQQLTSVFQATRNSSTCARTGWGKDNVPPQYYQGHRARSQFSPPNRGGNADGSSKATFDPTRMRAHARVEQEEVEEVGSEEDNRGFVGNDGNVEVDHAFAGEGWGEGHGADRSSDEVVRYDGQMLGKEDEAGEDPPRVGRGSGGGHRDTTDTAVASGMGVARGHGRREEGDGDSGSFGSGDGVGKGRSTVRSTVSTVSETSLGVDRNGRKEHIDTPAPPASGSPAAQVDPEESIPPITTPQEKPPPHTPVRPRTFSASTFSRGPPSSAVATSGGRGKWRPSFGGGGGGGSGADGTVTGRSPGAMHAPWAAFSTPLRTGGVGEMPPSGAGLTMGSTSMRRRRGGGAGTGPLGRLLQQVCGD